MAIDRAIMISGKARLLILCNRDIQSAIFPLAAFFYLLLQLTTDEYKNFISSGVKAILISVSSRDSTYNLLFVNSISIGRKNACY